MTSSSAAPLYKIPDNIQRILLNFLAQKGYRVSLDKTQLSSQQVTYLGPSLSPTSRSLTADRTQLLRNLQPPMTGDQILSEPG